MLTRQESSLSASRRQAVVASTTPPPSKPHHAKAIGCMSGIFKLFSRYQNPNKRLTFGRKQEKSKMTKYKNNNPPAAKEDKSNERAPLEDTNVLTSEIKEQDKNSRTPPSSSLVARLMGLEDLGASVKKEAPRPDDEEGRLTEKRRRLLHALEKCNEDLEALKRIIKAVEETKDAPIQSPPPRPAATSKTVQSNSGDALARSPINNFSSLQNSIAGVSRVQQQRKPIAAKKPGEDDEPIAKLPNKLTSVESSLRMRRQAAEAVTPTLCSRAMVKSVEEVCGDIAWGEKRETGRIGLALQEHLYRDLIEELVNELKPCSIQSLPFDACKRRLCF